jgi:hypothetical protein
VHHEAMEIISEGRQRLPTTVGPPNPALAGEEAKRAAQHLLDEARANADGPGRGWRKPRTARPSFTPTRRARTPAQRA